MASMTNQKSTPRHLEHRSDFLTPHALRGEPELNDGLGETLVNIHLGQNELY